MKIQSVFDKSFAAYGKVVEGYDFTALLDALEANSDKPEDAVIYVPSVPVLEKSSVYSELRDNCYGGMPIQIGYCNGTNTKLNCYEYHRDSEIDIAADDVDGRPFPADACGPFSTGGFYNASVDGDGAACSSIMTIDIS